MEHEKFIERCFDLAIKGAGHVAPNPLVGAVIVCENKVISEGYHQKYGSHHAEVNAVNSVADKSLLESSTLYINLEPCCFHGNTPACTDLILKHKIPKVVISNLDPHEKVGGKGVQILRDKGVEVVTGILEQKGALLNRRFFTFHKNRRPYVILKWAQTKDGFMDIDRSQGEKGIFWITGKEMKTFTHQMRAEEAGIVVGNRTVLNDDPELTCRAVDGKNPVRIVLDKERLINEDFKVLNNEAPTLIYNPELDAICKNSEWVKIDFNGPVIEKLLSDLYSKKILSIIVEGGRETLQSFIDHRLWDEIYVLEGNMNLEKGLSAPIIDLKVATRREYFGDSIIHLTKEHIQ